MSAYEILRKNIKNKLQQRNMSVSELEKRAGLKPSSIQSILLGRSKNPGIERVISLAKQFDCTVEELISPELDVSFSTIK